MAEQLDAEDLLSIWPLLTDEDRAEAFASMGHRQAEQFFVASPAETQAALLHALPPDDRRAWLRLLEPDDVVDLLQRFQPEEHEGLLQQLDTPTAREVRALLTYAADEAGGLMSPRFVQVRPDMTVEDAVSFVRRQSRAAAETIYYVFVTDNERRLLGVVSCRELLTAPAGKKVREIMHVDVVTVPADMDEEGVARVIAQHDLLAVPVVDASGRIQGIVTVDDIVDVVQKSATEDMQKLGGMEALDAPYLQMGLFAMLKKRAIWLAILFVGEMLTASAMSVYQDAIEKAVVLALFVPLIISSGGNSGSQATTLVIRAMALGEVKPRDWWRILRRELATGLLLGAILALIGLLRILAWQSMFGSYGEHWLRIAFTVTASLIGVVAWGTLSGAMLPFVLRKCGFDAASASAPFVATLVDVSGLLIYFNVAALLMSA